jgi:hypothetical protein
MVQEEHEVIRATQDIMNFAKSYQLSLEKPRGKLVEYFYRMKPHIYNELKIFLGLD